MIVDITRDGKKYKAIVPDNSEELMWQYGIIIGPPDLSGLRLPHEIEVRLNNELFNRGLISKKDLRNNINNVQGALMAALRVDAQTILAAYEEEISG